jgi:hypothetical protein
MFDFKPDNEKSKARIDAFWECELIDRPVVQFMLFKPADQTVPLPAAHQATARARWLDAEYQAELALATLANQEFLGDSWPVAYPNGFGRWIEVDKKCQAADKAIQVNCTFDELDLIMETLDPHGVYLAMESVPSREAAPDMLKKLERWALERCALERKAL